MSTNVETLLHVLDDETGCYETMRTLLADEKGAIGFSGKKEFDRIQHDKDQLVVRLQLLEEKRQRLVDRLAGASMNDDAPLTVTQLAGRMTAPDNRRLLDRAKRLRSIVGEVQCKNRDNQLLIQQYLKLIKGSLKMLTGLMDQTPVYARPGMRQPMAGPPCGAGRLVRGTV